MVERGDKKGLSTIVATLIIILLVLVAVGILWVVIRNVIKSGSEEISLGKLTVSLKIEKAQILNEENISVTVKREAGKGEISGLLFVIEDEGNSETVTKDLSLSEFELRTFILTLENMNTENVKTIKVVPLFKLESGKEIIGDVKDEYVISESSGEGGETPCVPNCVGRECGNDGCGGTCGTCSTGTCNSTGQCEISTPPSQNWQTGMVSWWKLDGNANDYLGVRNGVVNGATLITSGCMSGQCYNFTGTGDYISMSYASQYNIREGITLSAWIKRTTGYSQNQDVHVLSRNPSWYFYDAYATGSIRGEVYIDGARYGYRTTPVPNDGNWYHVLYTYNSTTRNSSIYRNGILYSTTQITGLTNYLIDSSTVNFANIGYQTLGRGLMFDELMIWNRSLNASEVQQVYNYLNPGGTPTTNYLSRSIIAGSDDAEEVVSTGAMTLTSTDLEITYDTANQHVGMRFQLVNVPRGATIQSAVLEFTCDESSSGAGSVTIFGQAIDNAPTFSTSTGNISSRALTSNSVSWTFNEAWVAGTKYNSSDLKNVIQEVVNRGGWNANNNLVIIITSDLTTKSNSRTAEAYEGTDVAKLYIEY